MVCRGGWIPGSSFLAAPARHSHHGACGIASVDRSRGRPAARGGSLASIVAAGRVIASVRTRRSIAGAARRRCSGVQAIFGNPRQGSPM
jgi:hypothetical protein